MTHRARKRFGQHFLDRVWAQRVVAAIAPVAGEVFLEIGPGQGALTVPLLAAARHVVGFEIDRDLVAALRGAAHPALTIVEGDFLDIPAAAITACLGERGLDAARLRVAGNLPYNVAAPMLFRIIELYESGVPIVDATVMLQREVAERVLAPVGTSEYGVLGVLVRHVAHATRRLALPPGAFRPAPAVHSAVVSLALHPPDPMPADVALFRSLVRAVFTRRRKTMTNALAAWPQALPTSAATLLTACDIDPGRRPETLDVAEFVRLADAVATAGPP